MFKYSSLCAFGAVCLFSLQSGLAFATEKYRDPSRPADYVDDIDTSVTGQKNEEMKPNFKLQGIFHTNGKFHALINGKGYKVGDKISGYTIQKITKNEVTLKNASGNQEKLSFKRITLLDNHTPIKHIHITDNKHTLKNLTNFYQNLKQCKHTSLDVRLNKTGNTQIFHEQIIGWKDDNTCLVMHRVASGAALCRYSKTQIKQHSTPQKIKDTAKKIEHILAQNTTKPLDTLLIEKPESCNVL